MSTTHQHAREKGLISDFDFGVAVPGGCEKFIKAAQAAALNSCTIVSCDIEKAFNNVLRRDLWRTVQFLQCPILSSWFCFFYHEHPRVLFAADPLSPFNINNVISYTLFEGVAQGDPLSSFLFVCTLSYILRGHRNRFPSFIRTSVIDDICFISAPDSSSIVPAALNDFSDILHTHNLQLNKTKTTLYCQSAFNFPTPSSFPYATSHQGFAVCRVHVGTPAFCARDADVRLCKIISSEESFQRLHKALDFCQTPGRGLIFIDLLRLCFRSRFAWDVRVLLPPSAILIANAADVALKRLLHLSLPQHPMPPLPLSGHISIASTTSMSIYLLLKADSGYDLGLLLPTLPTSLPGPKARLESSSSFTSFSSPSPSPYPMQLGLALPLYRLALLCPIATGALVAKPHASKYNTSSQNRLMPPK